MTSMLFIRHGQSTWNVERRWAGQEDPDLSFQGEQDVIRAARSCLAEIKFSSVTSSPLKRARRTAALIADLLKLPLLPSIPELSEIDVGEWGGLTSPEIEVRYPGMLDNWRRGRIMEFPGGESWQEFVDRVSKGITLAGQFANGNRILSVVHAGILRAVNHILCEPLITYPNLGGRWLGSDGYKIIATTLAFS